MNRRRLLPLGPTARIICVPARWLRDEALANRVPRLKAGKALLFDIQMVERVLLKRARAPHRRPTAQLELFPADVGRAAAQRLL
jgi:hypothetical protein